MNEVVHSHRESIRTAIRETDPHEMYAPPPAAALTPMEMIQNAVTSGAGIETLERLMALQERWEASESRKAYNQAIAAARSQIGPVAKTQTAERGKAGSYKYEDLAAIASVIDPVLAGHGLSYRFRTSAEGGTVRVTCIIAHCDGYSEETSLESAADGSGAKNPIQAMGSAVTYLQRYTLKAALGLAATKDDDAASAAPAPGKRFISADQYLQLRDEIDAQDCEAEFLAFAKIDNLHDLPAAHFMQAMSLLKRRRDEKAAGAA